MLAGLCVPSSVWNDCRETPDATVPLAPPVDATQGPLDDCPAHDAGLVLRELAQLGS